VVGFSAKTRSWLGTPRSSSRAEALPTLSDVLGMVPGVPVKL